MKTVTTTIKHKPGKVESVILSDGLGNLLEGRTYKYYAPYLKNIQRVAPDEQKRLARLVPLCFEHEKKMLELVSSKALPGVRLVAERPDLVLEIEYVAGNTLAHHLTAGVTHLESRLLVTSAVQCIACHHEAAITLNDTHPSNFLVSPQGPVLFCDYGNASSKELPFLSPPLASGNRKNETYFSEEQDKAFKADHDMDRGQCSAPYPSESLKSNILDCKGDFYVLARHLLDLDAGLFDKDLQKILEKMKQGKYRSADMILKDLAATAPKGVVTPEIEPVEQPVQAARNKGRRKTLSWPSLIGTPKWAAATVAGACLVTGLGIFGVQNDFFRAIIDENRPKLSAVQQSPEATPAQPPTQPSVNKSSSGQKQIKEDTPGQVSVVFRKTAPVLHELTSEPKEQIKTEKPMSPLNDKKSAEAHMLEKARLDAASADTAASLRGIEVLQKISGLKLATSGKALEEIGKQIEKLEAAAPSEGGRQRLELLAKYGHARAHYVLARWLEDGKGLRGGRDLAAAYRHYGKASRKVDKASEAIARLEKTAQSIVRNPPERNELFRLLQAIAERPENSQAQAAVGLIYAEGKYGQSRDKERAAVYLRKSLSNGFAEAGNVMRKYGIKG